MINTVNIIVPLKNEEKGIENLIENLIPVVKKIEKKTNITLIDDHSSDQTLDILKKCEKKFDFVKAFKNEKATGVGNAIKYGIEKNTFDAVIIFMGDCSDDPKDIAEYVKYLDAGYDCVFGSRFIKGSKLYDYPLIKLLLYQLLSFLFFRNKKIKDSINN